MEKVFMVNGGYDLEKVNDALRKEEVLNKLLQLEEGIVRLHTLL